MPAARPISAWGRFPVGRTDLRFAPAVENFADLRGARIMRGSGRSYGDAAQLTDGLTLETLRANRFIAFDEEAGVLHVEGGVTLEEILHLAVPRGWFLPVTPGTKFPTLAGCVACDVHGKNHHVDGNISTFVESLLLTLASGESVECSRERDPELFWATCGGMGLTGWIREVTLRLRPIETSSFIVRHDKCPDLDRVMELLSDHADDWRYSVAWIDCLARGKSLGRSILMRGAHARFDDLPRSERDRPLRTHREARLRMPVDCPPATLSPLTVRVFNFAYYHKLRAASTTSVEHYEPFFYPLDAIADWNRLYGRRGFVQYQCVLPYETSREGLVHLLETFSRTGHASFLAVLKTMGAEAGPLGFPRPGFTLALDIPMTGASLLALLDRLDERVAALGGRIYLGKDARMAVKWMPVMYPRLAEWQAVKRRVDPAGIFASDLSRRLAMMPR